jgi:hypothetical protein
MLAPPAMGSRSSVNVGAYAMAVPVAAHIPGWGLKFITVFAREVEEARMRPTTVVGAVGGGGSSESAIVADLEDTGRMKTDAASFR